MYQRINLDHNAGTSLDPRIIPYLASLLPLLQANPSSMHAFGRSARGLVSQARAAIASYLKVKPSELIFTSGGTESINMGNPRSCFSSAKGPSHHIGLRTFCNLLRLQVPRTAGT